MYLFGFSDDANQVKENPHSACDNTNWQETDTASKQLPCTRVMFR